MDCSSLTRADDVATRCGFTGEEIMFSSNDTPAEEFAAGRPSWAPSSTWTTSPMVEFLERGHRLYAARRSSAATTPAATFQLGESEEGFQVMDNPGDAKYGMTRAADRPRLSAA